MNIPQTILYATITQWEFIEQQRREDPTFDGWKFIAEKIGHKSASSLRKMCQERTFNNVAKLGFDDAIIIMSITEDYRLLYAMKSRLTELRRSKEERRDQLNLFSEPQRSLEEL